MDNIKSFEDACKVLGLDPKNTLPDFSNYPKEDREAMEAQAKLVIIAKALNYQANDNQVWKPDWSNWNEYKYYPWFEMGSPSGGGFSYDDYDDWPAHSHVGSRLCFKTRELAKYAGKEFEELYKVYFTL